VVCGWVCDVDLGWCVWYVCQCVCVCYVWVLSVCEGVCVGVCDVCGV
jgi:hypothetical protein